MCMSPVCTAASDAPPTPCWPPACVHRASKIVLGFSTGGAARQGLERPRTSQNPGQCSLAQCRLNVGHSAAPQQPLATARMLKVPQPTGFRLSYGQILVPSPAEGISTVLGYTSLPPALGGLTFLQCCAWRGLPRHPREASMRGPSAKRQVQGAANRMKREGLACCWVLVGRGRGSDLPGLLQGPQAGPGGCQDESRPVGRRGAIH